MTGSDDLRIAVGAVTDPELRRPLDELDMIRGARLADDPDHHHEAIDPRWSALATLADADPAHDEKRN